MASLPEGDQGGQLIRAPSESANAWSHGWRILRKRETTTLREDTPLKADVIVYDREAAKIEA